MDSVNMDRDISRNYGCEHGLRTAIFATLELSDLLAVDLNPSGRNRIASLSVAATGHDHPTEALGLAEFHTNRRRLVVARRLPSMVGDIRKHIRKSVLQEVCTRQPFRPLLGRGRRHDFRIADIQLALAHAKKFDPRRETRGYGKIAVLPAPRLGGIDLFRRRLDGDASGDFMEFCNKAAKISSDVIISYLSTSK